MRGALGSTSVVQNYFYGHLDKMAQKYKLPTKKINHLVFGQALEEHLKERNQIIYAFPGAIPPFQRFQAHLWFAGP